MLEELNQQHADLLASIEQLAARHAAIHLQSETKRSKVLELRSELERLDWELAERQARVNSLLSTIDRPSYNQYEHTAVLFRTGKDGTRLQRVAPNLALAMHDRIRRAELFILIAGMYDQYREWMAFEFRLAADLGKKIVAVLPPEQESGPTEIKYYVDKRFFPFDSDELLSYIEAVPSQSGDAV